MAELNYDELKIKIDHFNNEYPRPNLSLELEELSPIVTEIMWQNADKSGIYFLFNENKILQYIGKASFNSNIGRQIGVKFSSKDCRCLIDKFKSCSLLATIPLPPERAFEASSIEEYLITRIKPKLNVIGSQFNT